MSNKFEADGPRAAAVAKSMVDLAAEPMQFLSDLNASLAQLDKINWSGGKDDAFGESMRAQVEDFTRQLGEGLTAFSKVLAALPAGLEAGSEFVQKAQDGVMDSIHQVTQESKAAVDPVEHGTSGRA